MCALPPEGLQGGLARSHLRTAASVCVCVWWFRDLAPGLQLLGPIDDGFIDVVDIHEPLDSGHKDKCFISKASPRFGGGGPARPGPIRAQRLRLQGYDATSHFETTVEDVLDMYKRITGKDLDLSKSDLSKRQEA